jgi:hypothetical protein
MSDLFFEYISWMPSGSSPRAVTSIVSIPGTTTGSPSVGTLPALGPRAKVPESKRAPSACDAYIVIPLADDLSPSAPTNPLARELILAARHHRANS